MDQGETVMPVPGGEITTSEILVPVEEVVEDSTTEEEADDSTPEQG
jgi:hypothetical protein